MNNHLGLGAPKAPKVSFTMPKIDVAAIARQQREREEVDLGYAHIIFQRLVTQIQQFESTLQPDDETAVYLASFGTKVVVRIADVGYHNPYFITFDGFDFDTGQRVRLVQHVSQVSLLLTAVKVPKEENRQPRRIGFHIGEESPLAAGIGVGSSV